MFRMAVGHSDDIDLESALEAVFEECDAALAGANPQAGLLSSAFDIDHQGLLEAVRRHYPGIAIAGSSTAGEMTSVLGLQEDSVALAVFASDTVDITVGLGRDLAADPVAATRQAVAEARAGTSREPSLCIAMPTADGARVGVVLRALRDALGPGVPILGGGAAPRDPSSEPQGLTSLEFVGDVVTGDAVAILLFSGPLDFSFGVETGWRGVGPRAVITKATPGAVFEIDGQPALQFYERYLGTGGPPVANPLAVFEDDGGTRFYLRTPISFDRDAGSIGFFGAVPEGATVQLTVAATDQIFEGAKASIAEALAAFPGGGRPDGALVFSCATRKYLLGTRAGHEIEVVRDALGSNVPVSGFYCMGEIAPMSSPDLTRFHNATLVSVLLGSA